MLEAELEADGWISVWVHFDAMITVYVEDGMNGVRRNVKHYLLDVHMSGWSHDDSNPSYPFSWLLTRT